jgi:phage replication-related protein YjqB (UPF0714/DUF867 family)
MEYACMKELLARHSPDEYSINAHPGNVSVAIIAPHGGYIEPGTAEIAKEIAGATYSFYSFEAKPPESAAQNLHVTSANFNEPQCRQLISTCEFVVAIHGFTDHAGADAQTRLELQRNGTRDTTVYVGGLDEELRDAIAEELRTVQWAFDGGKTGNLNVLVSGKADDKFPGRDQRNICNWGKPRAGAKRGRGAQLEFSRTLRNELAEALSSESNLAKISRAVRRAVENAREKSVASAAAPPVQESVTDGRGAAGAAVANATGERQTTGGEAAPRVSEGTGGSGKPGFLATLMGGGVNKSGGAAPAKPWWFQRRNTTPGADDCLTAQQVQTLRTRIREAKNIPAEAVEELSATLTLAQRIRSKNIFIEDANDRLTFIVECLLAEKPQLIFASEGRLRMQLDVYSNSGRFNSFLAWISSGSPVGLVLVALVASLVLWTVGLLLVRVLIHAGGGTAADIFFMNGKALAVMVSAAFLGGVISIATRLQEFSRVRDLDPFAMFWTALLKPLIGVFLAMFILATLAGGIISFGFLDQDPLALKADASAPIPKKTLYVLWVLAFLAGFSERFAWDFVDRAQGVASGNPTGDKKPQP